MVLAIRVSNLAPLYRRLESETGAAMRVEKFMSRDKSACVMSFQGRQMFSIGKWPNRWEKKTGVDTRSVMPKKLCESLSSKKRLKELKRERTDEA